MEMNGVQDMYVWDKALGLWEDERKGIGESEGEKGV